MVVQVIPESVEKAESAGEVPLTVTSLVPSADAAIETKPEFETVAVVQEAPPFVEV